MKLLVLAFYAQFRVSAGRKISWATIMAYDNRPKLSWRPIFVENLIFYELGLNLLLAKVMSSVAWLAWISGINDSESWRVHVKEAYCFLKHLLQKSISNGGIVEENS